MREIRLMRVKVYFLKSRNEMAEILQNFKTYNIEWVLKCILSILINLDSFRGAIREDQGETDGDEILLIHIRPVRGAINI